MSAYPKGMPEWCEAHLHFSGCFDGCWEMHALKKDMHFAVHILFQAIPARYAPYSSAFASQYMQR